MFVLLSDGEAWSGEVAKSLKKRAGRAASRSSSSASARWPAARCRIPGRRRARSSHDPEVPTTSRLDRARCRSIAAAGGGQYFELDRDGDRHIANAIIDAGKRMAPSLGAVEQAEELYWRFLVVAAVFPSLGLLFLRDRPELWLQALARPPCSSRSAILGDCDPSRRSCRRQPLTWRKLRCRRRALSRSLDAPCASCRCGVAALPVAIDAGKAAGTATIDGTTIADWRLRCETRKDNLFDDKKRDTVYVLTDKALVTTRPDDEMGLSLKARSGELVVLALSGGRQHAGQCHRQPQGLNGLVILRVVVPVHVGQSWRRNAETGEA